jgi:hypothetical protein
MGVKVHSASSSPVHLLMFTTLFIMEMANKQVLVHLFRN